MSEKGQYRNSQIKLKKETGTKQARFDTFKVTFSLGRAITSYTENLPKVKSIDSGQTAQADQGRYFSQFP